ncbi:MAG: tetratricopeptide repeat-containing sensor histidine kinase [Bacteroidetes bacterium]|nr:tetratricopeptide repeat-containing sensor histidine kinase [Bacteroidota bacterium]
MLDSLNNLLSTSQKTISFERGNTLNFLGKEYMNESDYTQSMNCFSECLAIAEKLNKEDLRAAAERNMGTIYFYQHDYSKAVQLSTEAYKLFERENNLSQMGLLLKSLGDDFMKMGDSTKSSSYYSTALSIFKKIDDWQGQASVYANQSILCNMDYQHKIELALSAKRIWDVYHSETVLPAINIGNIGVAYLDIVRYDRLHSTKPSSIIPGNRKQLLGLSEKYLTQAINISESNNDIENASYYTGVLAELQAVKNDYKNAYINFRKYQDVTDSIYSQENKNKIAALESKRAIDSKNQEIEYGKLQINNEKRTMWFLAICVGFLTIIGALVFRQSLNRKKTNDTLLRLNKELNEANRLKVKFLAILSHDLRSPVANLFHFLQLQNDKPAFLSENEKAMREKRISDMVKSLLDNMEAMLLWSKGQMEHFMPSFTDLKVEALFEYIKKMFSDNPDIILSFELPANLTLHSDVNFLQTIMYNLTANAVKAVSHSKGPKIVWKAWYDEGKNYLSITDNGSGIHIEKLRGLFEEKNVDSSSHGMGFHIVRDLASSIGCSITYKVEKNNGSTFILCI